MANTPNSNFFSRKLKGNYNWVNCYHESKSFCSLDQCQVVAVLMYFTSVYVSFNVLPTFRRVAVRISLVAAELVSRLNGGMTNNLGKVLMAETRKAKWMDVSHLWGSPSNSTQNATYMLYVNVFTDHVFLPNFVTIGLNRF